MIRRVYNACWYLVGGFILLAAVSITIIRLLLPGIDAYREEIENLAIQYSGYPVSIDSVNAEWRGWKPHLYLEGVILHDPDNLQPIATFKSAHVSFAFFDILVHQRVVPESLTVSGANLKLIRASDGSIRFGDENIQYAQERDESQISKRLTRWLLSQPLITLNDTSILWIDELRDQPPLQLREASLNLRTWREQIQIDGSASLPRGHGQSVDFALDATGDLLSGQWSGQAYVTADDLEPSAWPEYSRWQDISLAAGKTDINIWSRWEDARLISAEGLVSSEDTLIRGHDSNKLIRNMNAEFNLQRSKNADWSLQILLRDLSTWSGNWPATDIRLGGSRDQDIDYAYISYARIEDFLPLAGIYEALSGNLGENYRADSFHGVLQNFEYRRHSNSDSWIANGRINNLELIDRHGNSTISGIGGKFISTSDRGRLVIDNTQFDIRDPAIFQLPVRDISVNGTVDWYQNNDDSVLLRTDSLRLDTEPHTLTLRGNIVYESESLPYIDIIASLTDGDAEPLKRFVPAGAKDKLKRWIDRGIVSGYLEYGGMVLRGDLDDFPFKNGEGQFKINTRFSEVTMDYHEEWPPLYQIDGDVILEQDVLSVYIPSGDIFQSRIMDVYATIRDLYENDHILHIEGNARGSAKDAIKFLKNSPLEKKKTIKRLLDLGLDGDIQLALDMDIALFPGEDNVNGNVRLLGNQIKVPRLGLDLNDTSGHIHFSGDEIRSRELAASYYDSPVELSVSREGEAEDTPITFSMKGKVHADLLTRILKDRIPPDVFDVTTFGERLTGQSVWTAELKSNLEPDQPQDFSISSSLEGLAIDLPAPLGKQKNTSRDFLIDLELPPESEPVRTLNLSITEIVSAHFGNDGLTIAFGSDTGASPSARQLNIIGNTEELDLDGWLAFLMEHQLLPEKVTDKNNKWPVNVDLTAEQLEFYNQSFSSVRLTILKSLNQWEFTLAGRDIAGQITVPGDRTEQTLTADFQRLNLASVTAKDGAHQAAEIDPRDFPALNINVDQLTYDGTDFGNFTLQADKINAGLRINSISFDKPELEIQGNGEWRSVNDEIFSQFFIELRAGSISEMLSTFGYYHEAFEGGETEINLVAAWPGNPIDFRLANMNGTLELNVVKGRFLDIEPKAGRLFGLLSIQALPRRLSLDFSDLFNKGFAFDRIHGNFTIEDGHAYTNDLTMDGPSALVTVTGRTGLVTQNYDQIVTVIPQISDTLPVTGALFGPIGIGIGAVIFLTGKVFESIPEQIDKMLGYQYSVQGSWDEPVIKPLNRNKEQEQEQQRQHELLGQGN
ncbi:MAG: YhdP family protein [Gammaproteobacteria bacterium]|nr:YhdP family protein [Gammaproteobacteria bacterium]